MLEDLSGMAQTDCQSEPLKEGFWRLGLFLKMVLGWGRLDWTGKECLDRPMQPLFVVGLKSTRADT